MKKTWFALLIVAIACSLTVTGCGSKKKEKGVTPLPGSTTGGKTGTGTGPSGPEIVPPVPGPEAGPGGVNVGGNPGEQGPRDGLAGMIPDREALKNETVYFEYDRSAVRQGEQAKVQAVAKVLKDRPGTKVQIEGHCDERGTEEYNRSLGERRALALREFLMSLGIDGSRVFTVSFGEDKPAVPGHAEGAWSKNRRGEFILYSKP
jgi:peptidoglycan-associated lipoprotein